MIDPKELRKGNYIQPMEGKDWWGYKFKKIQYIGQDGEFARESDMGQCDVVWNIKDADPMPITPEWLEWLGFKKVNPKISDPYWSKDAHEFEIHWDGKTGTVLNCSYDGGMASTDVELEHITSIHQLQNLYFALTGQELTYQNKNDAVSTRPST